MQFFDLDATISRYTDRLKPHLGRCGDLASMFATGVIERLDRIIENTEDSQITAQRRYYTVNNIPAGNILTMAGVTDLADNNTVIVPANEDWQLEYAYARCLQAGGNAFYLLADDVDIVTISPSGASIGTQSFGPPIIQGGTKLQVLMGAGAATSGKVRLQFQVKRKVGRRAAITGVHFPVADREDARQETALELRHAGTFLAGRNVNGAGGGTDPQGAPDN